MARERLKFAGFKSGAEFAKHPGDERRLRGEHGVEGDGRIGDGGPIRGYRLRIPDANLPELDEVAAGPKHREARGDEVAGQRVEDDIDALATGALAHFLGKLHRARIHDVGDAEGAEVSVLFGAARGRINLRARAPGQLDCGQPDSARRGVNQYPLPRGERGQMIQRIVRREKARRESSRRLPCREAGRFADNQCGGSSDEHAESSERDRHHFVAHAQMLDVRPDGADRPRTFEAEFAGLAGDRCPRRCRARRENSAQLH